MQTIKKLIKRIIGGERSFILLSYHRIKGVWSAVKCGFPTKGKLVLGVTGTDGKTTTITLLGEMLEAAGMKVGLASTTDFRDGKNRIVNETKKTTLSPMKLNKFLKQIKDDVDVILVEVSSHALEQNRLFGIKFKYGVITNLSREHLDYHKTMEEYAKAKGKLLDIVTENGGEYVLNKDNKWFEYFSKYDDKAQVYFSKFEKNSYLYTEKINKNEFVLKSEEFKELNDQKIYTDLLGDYNLENILGAILLARFAGASMDAIKLAIKDFKGVLGRLELFEAKGKPKVIIDYAVTPDSLQKVYENVSANYEYDKLIAVFGSCGDRDKGKRPKMSELIDGYTNYIVLTNEDPYTEDPQAIIDEVEGGIQKKKLISKDDKEYADQSYFKIIDRREALDFAINKLGTEKDLIVVTGKGAETNMMIGTELVDFNEREIIQEVLNY